MAVIEHPDMPNSMLGIQGLNPWNILFLFILIAWRISRKRECLQWDMPNGINLLLVIYFVFILIGVLRLLGDKVGLTGTYPTNFGLLSENLINCVKWVILGLLLFDGCRTKKRFLLGLSSLLVLYFLLSLQVIKWMPFRYLLSGDDLSGRSAKILVNEIGYHRVNMSMMLAGASWAIFTTKELVNTNKKGFFILMASGIVFFAQLLTGGRTGYATWAIIGLVLCFLRWRKYLIWVPIAVILMLGFVPGALERMTAGFSSETHDTNSPLRPHEMRKLNYYNNGVDLYTITSGRTFAWPFVIEKIKEAPVLGYGRMAMQRTGISSHLWTEFGESFPHPHNAYLEFILDNGIIGIIPILIFYLMVIKYSVILFMDSSNSIYISIGGICLSLVLALMVASIGSQTFYPREGSVGMWCSIGLMMRVYVERKKLLEESGKDNNQEPKIFNDRV